MRKCVMVIIGKLFSMIRIFLSWLKKHILWIQFVVAMCCIIFCLSLFYIWNRTPYKSVTYTTKMYGCVGKLKCKILAIMDYGSENIKNDSTGFYIIMFHPFREHSPYLFKGDAAGKERYLEEYEPLCYRYCSVIDSISILYKSIITLESNLYDVVKPKDREIWSNEKDFVIWHQPSIVRNKTTSESESWFYLKHKTRESHGDTIGMGHRLLTSYDNFFPKWSSKGNVSKLKLRLKINNYGLIDCEEITIRFNGGYNLYSISPEPDEKGSDYIRFTNPFKLKVICKNGLELYSYFPDLEGMQQTRITVLVVIIIPLLLTWLLYIRKKMVLAQRKSRGTH